jgi:hypothetical protein
MGGSHGALGQFWQGTSWYGSADTWRRGNGTTWAIPGMP